MPHIRVDFYIIKNEAYNFYEHHINSKSSKYHRWEDFDFLDFEYVESLKDLSSLVYKNTNTTCYDIYWYIIEELEEPYSNLEFWDCINNAFCVCARCQYYTEIYDYMLNLCSSPSDAFHPGYFQSLQNMYCNGYGSCKQIPCPGDIVKDMEIAPTQAGGKKAGMFGDVRKDKKQNPRHHNGMDIATQVGTPFVAMCDGKVEFAGYNLPSPSKPGFNCWIDPKDKLCKSAFGNFIRVKSTVHGKKVVIAYAHLSQNDVTVGQTVKQGQVLGLSGNSGNASADKDIVPHVHITTYEKINGKEMAVDPAPYFNTQFDANGIKDPNTGNCK